MGHRGWLGPVDEICGIRALGAFPVAAVIAPRYLWAVSEFGISHRGPDEYTRASLSLVANPVRDRERHRARARGRACAIAPEGGLRSPRQAIPVLAYAGVLQAGG